MLYIDYFYRTTFIKEFDRDNQGQPNEAERISFAHNARTICIAFVALAARYRQGSITDQDLTQIQRLAHSESGADAIYDIFRDLEDIQYFIKPEIFADKNQYDALLRKLFNVIINMGVVSFLFELRHDSTLNATNYLKRDANYYDIIGTQWAYIKNDINSIFTEFGM